MAFKQIPVDQATLGELVDSARAGQRVILLEGDHPAAAVVPVADLERLEEMERVERARRAKGPPTSIPWAKLASESERRRQGK